MEKVLIDENMEKVLIDENNDKYNIIEVKSISYHDDDINNLYEFCGLKDHKLLVNQENKKENGYYTFDGKRVDGFLYGQSVKNLIFILVAEYITIKEYFMVKDQNMKWGDEIEFMKFKNLEILKNEKEYNLIKNDEIISNIEKIYFDSNGTEYEGYYIYTNKQIIRILIQKCENNSQNCGVNLYKKGEEINKNNIHQFLNRPLDNIIYDRKYQATGGCFAHSLMLCFKDRNHNIFDPNGYLLIYAFNNHNIFPYINYHLSIIKCYDYINSKDYSITENL